MSDLGEFTLIDRIKQILPQAKHPDVLIGLGDDTAVIKIDHNKALIATCDIQIEDQHFRLKHISTYQLGRRAIAVNLSDIASMGGKPSFALVSLGLPPKFSVIDYDRLFQGIKDELSQYSAHLVGGNLAKTENKLIVDVTMLGEVHPDRLLSRSGSKVGDKIFVTGKLGESGAGFHILEAFGQHYPEKYANLVKAHLQPTPRIEAGKMIAETEIATSMIDISDGIASDLYHICQMSGVGAEIHSKRLPLPENIEEVSEIAHTNPLNIAMHSGEDYELLFTVKPDVIPALITEISNKLSLLITEIGHIVTRTEGYYLIDSQQNRIPILPKGWDHFQKETK